MKEAGTGGRGEGGWGNFWLYKAGSAELVALSKPYCRKTVSYHPILFLHVFLLELGVPRPKNYTLSEPRVLLALKPSVARPTNHSLIGNELFFLRWYPKTPKNHLANNVRARL